SPTMTEGNIARWLKKEGDKIKSGEVMLEIETDKATMEVEAVDEGTLGKILVAAGTQGVKVNAPIGYILAAGESAADIPAAGSAMVATKAVATPPTAVTTAVATAVATATPAPKSGRVFATPLAKVLAKQAGLDLAAVAGSGPHGRIVKADVEKAVAGGGKSVAAPTSKSAAVTSDGPTPFELIPHTTMRKVIAKRLTESKSTVPHFYVSMDMELDALLKLRGDLNRRGEKAGYKLSVNDFIMRAVALALVQHPGVNSAWSDAGMMKFGRVDVSVAVSLPAGLITPIVTDAAHKSLVEISAEVKSLVARAKDNKLKPHEFQGGTFSVSNLGMYGVTSFIPIINPPQSCILGVGAGLEKPVIRGGKIELGTVMNCTMACDHRAVDGVLGAEFLQTLKGLIEDPLSLLV
ncbi:MAG: pyruvate dehydrogenase complex dihydrolipoamide acetyltransferase, partial [Candidatus Pacebacteria bacterium]|nr:pyruvate dehydrogenase complex dihydrolipoamide acetyltransferase [Candidatus Paceibacterota bacterium]